jgi:hypothetical protein
MAVFNIRSGFFASLGMTRGTQSTGKIAALSGAIGLNSSVPVWPC